MAEGDGRQRVIIERVEPEIDAGRFPIKRTTGERIVIEADIFADGHDVISAVLKVGDAEWPMTPLVNDRWRGEFSLNALGVHNYTIEAWINHFETWRRDLDKKIKAGVEIGSELVAGTQMIEQAAARAPKPESRELQEAANRLLTGDVSIDDRISQLMNRYTERRFPVRYERDLKVFIEPELARFSAWYEMFPRSVGTFRDCERVLPEIADLGFDILYFPPIHPIGTSFRKGPNNRLEASPNDPGSPWAIGSEDGGHKSIHPELGTLDDFRHLVAEARKLNLHVALDIAFQCSPDHPYVHEHKEWFRIRPDGSIQYAENPPKKYQDIYPINFETEDWHALWEELRTIFQFWIDQGVQVFRVDNPHTKSFRFWEWCISSLKEKHPELIFLSEAFTRPKVMYYLAKLGFTQSYNYFPWRNHKRELTEYFTELTRTQVKEYFRANLWPNTPDILTEYLQFGGRPAFMTRFILAATLGASYGIYGPAFELCENKPRERGSEEYLNSEKYEIRHWDTSKARNMRDLIKRVNQARRAHPALQSDHSLEFLETDNEQIIAYSKSESRAADRVIAVINLDPHHTQRGWVSLPLEPWGISPTDSLQFHDLLTDARFLWSGRRIYVELDPQFVPAHLLVLRRYVRTERDFDYFL
ncbi:MAG TPA: alpha-1,4-glucan--maltose-1-phosphate maltosyltransferase [Verrucomicrobiae bacterium]|nr:alpha-1,4-glucan--maltose-1-phosphate maltosyltransferase [Verrucomicrobiae bacterium]